VVFGLLGAGAPAAATSTAPLLGVTASGTGLVLLTAGGDVAQVVVPEDRQLVTVDAVWSPGGTRVAFTSPRDGVGRDVWVVNADGTGLRPVTSGSDADHYDAVPVWISATEIAYYHRDNTADRTELRAVDLLTGAVRLLVADADANFPPLMQPSGSLLLYTTHAAEHRATVDVRTGAQQSLPDVRDVVAWAPDGLRLAYGNQAGLFVIRPDGSDRRTLVGGHNVRSVDWSPDGRRLAVTFADIVAYTKVGPAALSNVYTVDLDGSNLQRLTGLDSDTAFTGPSDFEPRWWPGGGQLFFTTGRPLDSNYAPSIWTMNADGSCEQPWTNTALRGVPAWRPGASDGESSGVICTSVIVRVRSTDRVALRQHARIPVQVKNDGTLPLTNLRLDLSSNRGVIGIPEGCADRGCTVASLGLNEYWNVTIPVWARTGGPIRVRVRAQYDGGRDVFTADDGGIAGVDVWPCDLVGYNGPDRLIGTARAEIICGRGGDDRIEGGGGNDQIDAGFGNDTIVGGSGHDRITGGGGSDVVLIRDHTRDVLDCGPQRDTVVADADDVVMRTCEIVARG
jgi:Tol biopolymer transport system component